MVVGHMSLPRVLAAAEGHLEDHPDLVATYYLALR
jgi:hypothetical protein